MPIEGTTLSRVVILSLLLWAAAGWAAEPVGSVWRCYLPQGTERPVVEIPYELPALPAEEPAATPEGAFPVRAWSFCDWLSDEEDGRQVIRRRPLLCWFDSHGNVQRVRLFSSARWAWASRDGTTVLYLDDVIIDEHLPTRPCTATIHCEGVDGEVYWERRSDCVVGTLSPDGDLAILTGGSRTEILDRTGAPVARLGGQVNAAESAFVPEQDRLMLLVRERVAPPGLDRMTTAVCLTSGGDTLWSTPIGRTHYSSAGFAVGDERIFLGYCLDRWTPRERRDPLPVVVCLNPSGDELARIEFEDRPAKRMWLDYDPEADELVVGLSRVVSFDEGRVTNDVLRLDGDDLSITLDIDLIRRASMHGVLAGPGCRTAVGLVYGNEQRGEVVVYEGSEVAKRVSTSPRLSGLDRIASPPLIVAGSGRYWDSQGPKGFVELIPWD
jgi:hypothetical protein